MEITLRSIQEKDNVVLASIVRNALAEFGANRPGTVYFDPTTDSLFEMFQAPRSVYFVAERANEILGGGGIYPTDGLPGDTCELVKMYLVPAGRGLGLGKLIIEKCFSFARDNGFKKIYLETMPELQQALNVYEKFGFGYLDGPLGNSGHYGCNRWMLKEL